MHNDKQCKHKYISAMLQQNRPCEHLWRYSHYEISCLDQMLWFGTFCNDSAFYGSFSLAPSGALTFTWLQTGICHISKTTSIAVCFRIPSKISKPSISRLRRSEWLMFLHIYLRDCFVNFFSSIWITKWTAMKKFSSWGRQVGFSGTYQEYQCYAWILS